jgi:hypothetical protein
MNDTPREQLKYIIGQYGRSISEDPKRCEALLRDFCGQYRKEINVLVSAIKEAVTVDLSNLQHRVPSDLLLAQLTKRLEDRLAIDPIAARWSVESWAIALGLISEQAKNIAAKEPIKNNPLPPDPPLTKPTNNPPPPKTHIPAEPVKNNYQIPTPPPPKTVVKNQHKSSFLKRIIPAMIFGFVGFVGFGISRQTQLNQVFAYLGTWQEVRNDGSVAIVDFKSNGRFTFQQSLSKSQVSNGGDRYFESHGTYQMTEEGWVVQTIQEARIGSNGNWDYCPSQSNANNGCDVAFNGLEKELNRPKQVKMEMDTSTQELIIGNQKYRRFR